MTWKLWLDDVRVPPDFTWTWAKTSNAAAELILQNGLPSEMSLDHDLDLKVQDGVSGIYGGSWHGDSGDTGMNFLKWLWKHMNVNLPGAAPPKWAVHSANPCGKANMESFLRTWEKSIEVTMRSELKE